MAMPSSRSRDAARQVREGRVPVGRGALYVRETGVGETLLVLHGGPDFNHEYLLPELDRLARDWRLICYDQRGRGKSSPGFVADDVTIDSELDDLDRVRRHAGSGAVTLLGHSWGCLLAMEYAVRHPDRVTGLVLVNTAPASHGDLLALREHRAKSEPATLERMRAIAATRAFAEVDVATEADYYRAHFHAALHRPEQVEIVVGRLRSSFGPEDVLKARAIEHRLYEQTWLSPNYDLLARLRSVNLPAIVLHGDRDFIPAICARHVAEAIPGARLIVLQDCGHFAFLERLDEAGQAIAGWRAQR